MQFETRARPEPPSHRAALIAAAVLVVVLQRFVPYGALILYPFTLLSTWVHEMGHGVTALLCGGRFSQLLIYGNASGLAEFTIQSGYREALTAAAGLLAPPLVGALLLALARRASKAVLWVLMAAMLVSLVLYVRTQVGWLVLPGLLLLIAVVAHFGGNEGRMFFVQLIGLLLGLDTVSRMGYLFMQSASVGGAQRPSDIAGVARVLGGPYQLWGWLLAAISVLLLLLGLWAAWHRPAPRRRPTASP